jgi:hypothetical protein
MDVDGNFEHGYRALVASNGYVRREHHYLLLYK